MVDPVTPRLLAALKQGRAGRCLKIIFTACSTSSNLRLPQWRHGAIGGVTGMGESLPNGW